MLNFIVIVLVVFELIGLAGCIPLVKEANNEGERPVNTGPLSALNGENYDSSVTVGPVVMLQKKKRELVIAGDARFQTELIALPAKFIKLQLFKNDKAIQEIQSDAEGHFLFRGSFQEGEYFIKQKSDLQQVGFKVAVQNTDIIGLILLIDKTQKL